MNGGIILFDHESRVFKYSVKPGRITLARLSVNRQKNKKRSAIAFVFLDEAAFGYVFSPEKAPKTTVIPR